MYTCTCISSNQTYRRATFKFSGALCLPCLPSFLSISGTLLGAPLPPPDPQEFSSGDYVKVELDQDVLRLMQEGHGGWSLDMGDVSMAVMLSAKHIA